MLEGRSDEVNQLLERGMEQAAERLQFERAALMRDQLASLRKIQATADREQPTGDRDLDAFALVGEPGEYAVSVMLIRGGTQARHHQLFPAHAWPAGRGARVVPDAVLRARGSPPEVLVNLDLPDAAALEEALASRSNRKTRVARGERGALARDVALATENADQALRCARPPAGRDDLLAELGAALELPTTPQRLECFDISHTGGEGTVASCVVYGPEGALKKEYRRFNIEGVTPGDDYGALRQAVRRRYTRIAAGEFPAPDVLFIDGGAGQMQRGAAGARRTGLRRAHAGRRVEGRRIASGAGAAASARPRVRWCCRPIRRRCAWSSACATKRIDSRSRATSAARAAPQRIDAGDRAGARPVQAPRTAASSSADCRA